MLDFRDLLDASFVITSFFQCSVQIARLRKFSLMWCLDLVTILLDDMLGLMKFLFYQCSDHLLPPRERALENLETTPIASWVVKILSYMLLDGVCCFCFCLGKLIMLLLFLYFFCSAMLVYSDRYYNFTAFSLCFTKCSPTWEIIVYCLSICATKMLSAVTAWPLITHKLHITRFPVN